MLNDRNESIFTENENLKNVISWIRENSKDSNQPIQLPLYSLVQNLKGYSQFEILLLTLIMLVELLLFMYVSSAPSIF